MNQEKIIQVILKKKNESDILEFNFDEKKAINLNNASNVDLKNLFQYILTELSKEKFKLDLIIDQKYDVGLYKDVCKEYIKSLNEEISELITSLEWKEIFENEMDFREQKTHNQ